MEDGADVQADPAAGFSARDEEVDGEFLAKGATEEKENIRGKSTVVQVHGQQRGLGVWYIKH